MIPFTNYNANLPEWLVRFFKNIYVSVIFFSETVIYKTIFLNLTDFFYPIKKVILSEEHKFLESNKERFIRYIDNNNLNSINIDQLFYQKKDFTEYMRSQNTELETTWKTRILLARTPRGNIIMYYDPYKLGFAYYSDQNVISYDILNSVAMRYVITYNCLHFFIDEFTLPEDAKNPLKLHYIDEKKSEVSLSNHTTLSPFMKPKQNTNQIKSQDKLRNKFIYLGTMRNFSPCQKPVKKVVQGFASVLLDNIDSGMNWSSYKKQLNDK